MDKLYRLSPLDRSNKISARLCYDFRYSGPPKGFSVKLVRKAILPAMIAQSLLMLAANTWAQERQDCEELQGTPPGLYTTTDEGRTFLVKDDKIVEMKAGEAGFADEGTVKCIKRPPKFMDWPCSTQAAQSRMFNTYTVTELETKNPLKEIVQRYFDIPEVLAPIPNWIDGEYSAIFNYSDLLQFSSPEYWYHPDPDQPILYGKRPRSLQVSLYVGINQVVLDNNMIDALRADLGTDEIPVTFVFNDSNTVPISYFGANVSLEEIFKAFNERGIKVADPPMWWQGDYHLKPTIEEYEKFFEIPALEDIDPDKRAALEEDLKAHGFSRKPIIVSLFAESESWAVDQPERLRVAASLGITRIPTTFNFIEPDLLVARCGPGTPAGSGAVSGATTPIGGPTLPPGAPVVPPPPEVIPPPIDPEEPVGMPSGEVLEEADGVDDLLVEAGDGAGAGGEKIHGAEERPRDVRAVDLDRLHQ